jgi:hypothetical protein
MQPRTGYYFLIQYCPDHSRQEAANVGVVLFCPEPFYLKARTARGNGRIRRFFRPVDPDWDRINSVNRSIERRLTVDREISFATSRPWSASPRPGRTPRA